jgi:membrane-associated phospholipid phosphatase
MLILWFLWPWKVGRIFGLLYLALIVFATLGSGQHYLFDLIVAIPYTATILYLGRLTSIRRSANHSIRESQATEVLQ